MIGLSCVAPKKAGVVAPTQTDRLLRAYPEIQNGRLLILADFEDEKQMGLFQLDSATNPGRLARDPKKGRTETGPGALAVQFIAPNESVVIASPREGDAFLKRDWRPYDLMMMAVSSPAAGLTLEIKIVGGAGDHAVTARTETALTAGWNLLRFDVSEIGEQVPLDDIQEIRLALSDPPGAPATLYFDDFLLAGNRRDMLGDSANQSGSLYVQNAGRHWNVGAGGRFEISFCNGQITRWFNLAADPYRLQNLVRGTSLGPTPVLVGEGNRLAPAPRFRDALNVRQRILEMNEIRVVLEATWESGSVGKAAGQAASERWMYTIYPTGQIFVSADAVRPQGDPSPQSALTINMAWMPSAPTIHFGRSGGGQGSGESSQSAAFALARIAEADAALLFIPYFDADPAQITDISDATARTTSLVWSRNAATGSTNGWQCQLFLTSSSAIDEAQATSRANDYTQPGSIRIDVGRAQTGRMIRSDGFDPGTGCFHVATDGNRARVIVEGKKRPVYSPAFQVNGDSRDQAWVYVNYLLHPGVVRGPQGDLLFQLPGTATKEVVVEPLFKKSP